MLSLPRVACRIVLIERERLAQLFAQLGGGLVERFQHLLFAVGAGLHFGERVAARGIDRIERHHVLGSHLADRSHQQRFHAGALGDFASDGSSDALVRGLAHQGQGLAGFFVGDHVQEGRLLKINGQCLLERPVEDSVPGGVDEIGEENRVLFCDGLRARRAQVDYARHAERKECREGHENFPKGVSRHSHDRCAGLGRRDETGTAPLARPMRC